MKIIPDAATVKELVAKHRQVELQALHSELLSSMGDLRVELSNIDYGQSSGQRTKAENLNRMTAERGLTARRDRLRQEIDRGDQRLANLQAALDWLETARLRDCSHAQSRQAPNEGLIAARQKYLATTVDLQQKAQAFGDALRTQFRSGVALGKLTGTPQADRIFSLTVACVRNGHGLANFFELDLEAGGLRGKNTLLPLEGGIAGAVESKRNLLEVTRKLVEDLAQGEAA
ncbi:MAG TPA: hypothetical protein VGG27_06740 [Magnetospirillaceae bacterium]|jgi:hypothetical protein